MNDDFLPTTEEVMQGWAITESERRAWLAEYTRQVRRDTWIEALDAANDRAPYGEGVWADNPYEVTE